MSGLGLQGKLNEVGASIPVIILTGHADVPMAVRALKSGAIDFIQKPYRDQLLLDSINSALAADEDLRQATSDGTASLDDRLTTLTEREREVFDKLLGGSSSKQIARVLNISHRTVEAHRQNILRKFEVGSVNELLCLLVSPADGG